MLHLFILYLQMRSFRKYRIENEIIYKNKFVQNQNILKSLQLMSIRIQDVTFHIFSLTQQVEGKFMSTFLS